MLVNVNLVIKEQKLMGYNKRNNEINAITKESIAFAYYELLQKEQRISVTLICEKAGVSRNAYYRNYGSTDEIIIYCLFSAAVWHLSVSCFLFASSIASFPLI